MSATMSKTELEALVGLTMDEARQIVAQRPLAFRILTEDGESFPATADYRTDRVNVHVQAGRVTAADVG